MVTAAHKKSQWEHSLTNTANAYSCCNQRYKKSPATWRCRAAIDREIRALLTLPHGGKETIGLMGMGPQTHI